MKIKNPMNGPGPSVAAVPEGDNRERLTCPDCGYIEYANPKLVVGAVCLWEEKILLCRRAIEPRIGAWTIPAGFMEVEESLAEGAAREVYEEACATVEMGDLIGIYEIPPISQVHVFHTAQMLSGDHAAGEESLETALFAWEDIPWDEIAFPSIKWALKRFGEQQHPTFHIERERMSL